jgi:hypothetical protein
MPRARAALQSRPETGGRRLWQLTQVMRSREGGLRALSTQTAFGQEPVLECPLSPTAAEPARRLNVCFRGAAIIG